MPATIGARRTTSHSLSVKSALLVMRASLREGREVVSTYPL